LNRQARLRWSGIAGIAGSVGYTIGDALLIGNSATATEFPHLAVHLDNLLVQRSAIFLASSTERLAAGALVGVFSTPLMLAGLWHICEASKPGGTRWSLPPFYLLVIAFSIAPFVHGSFFYVAEILKTIGQVDGPAQAALIALATRTTLWLFIAYGVLAVPALIGFVWLTIAIVRGKTMYPRSVAYANPLVCMLAGLLVDRVLPQPLALLLSGAGLSLGMLAFYALSTALLWSSPASAPQR
jgi:uncharacterized protein DUF6796